MLYSTTELFSCRQLVASAVNYFLLPQHADITPTGITYVTYIHTSYYQIHNEILQKADSTLLSFSNVVSVCVTVFIIIFLRVTRWSVCVYHFHCRVVTFSLKSADIKFQHHRHRQIRRPHHRLGNIHYYKIETYYKHHHCPGC